jgi:hypothetical protein
VGFGAAKPRLRHAAFLMNLRRQRGSATLLTTSAEGANLSIATMDARAKRAHPVYPAENAEHFSA